MSLETATYTNDLVTSNPAHSDGLNQADAHLRLIKGTLKATFPNFTSAALNSTQAQLDGAATIVNTTGVSMLANAGAFFKTNTTDGITNPAAGEVDFQLAGVVGARFVNAAGVLSVTLPGALSVTGAISGPGTIPVGGMIMWLADTLPTGAGSWCWANGGTLPRTGASAGLFALWGTTYGAGDGSTTFNVINMQEVAPVGKSTMGGASSPGLLPSIATGVKTVLGSLFGSDTHTLTAAEIPSHYHYAAMYDPTHTHGVTGGTYGSSSLSLQYYQGGNQGGAGSSISISNASTGVRINAGNGLDYTGSTGGGGAHNITQPSRAVNFIVRYA